MRKTRKNAERKNLRHLCHLHSNHILHQIGLKSEDYQGNRILIAVGLIIINFVFQLLPAWPVIGWLAQTDFLLHIGLIVGFLGILLGDIL